jgi:hypothetical protein
MERSLVASFWLARRRSFTFRCSDALTKNDISQKLIAKGKAEAEYLVCFPNFMCSVSYQFFDTDRLRVLILTIWFFSGNISGYMNRRNTELLTFSAGLGRNTAGLLGSMLKKLSKLTNDSDFQFSLLFTYNVTGERLGEQVGRPNG